MSFWKKGMVLSAYNLNKAAYGVIKNIMVDGMGITQTRNGDAVTLSVPASRRSLNIARVTLTENPGSGTPQVGGVRAWNGDPAGFLSPQFYVKLAQPHSISDPVNDFLVCAPCGGTDQTDLNDVNVLWEELFSAVGVCFKVTLNQVGGADGTAPDTPATWTYDVTDIAGKLIASAKSPDMPRILNCDTVKATAGLAYYDSSLTAHLAEAWETFGGEVCTIGG